MNTNKKPQKSLFQVRYAWTIDGIEHNGRTVVTATSRAEAEAKFQRQSQHVRVVPIRRPS